jgi:hypothetical protein
LKEGRRCFAGRKPLGLRFPALLEVGLERVRGAGRRKALLPISGEEKPERRKSSGEQWLHPGSKPKPGAGCTAGLVSENRWSVRVRPLGLATKRKSGTTAGNGTRATGWNKALKGKAHECGELKKASKNIGAHTAERVAKPCGWHR